MQALLLLFLWLFSAFCCLYCCLYDFSLHQVFEDSPDLDHSAFNALSVHVDWVQLISQMLTPDVFHWVLREERVSEI